ncbi:50S ribosomal protein L6 [soil metagenome]
MSRIGRKSIPVPANVKVAIKDRKVDVTGPLGTLSFTHRPEVQVAFDADKKELVCTVDETKLASTPMMSALWGTTRANLASNVIGVTKGYLKEMDVVGVGWTAAVQGDKLKLVVGFANPILMDIPKGIKVSVDKSAVKVEGADKQMVGQFASTMRQHRKPEPYNGKGIKYREEVIKRKSGKAFGTA